MATQDEIEKLKKNWLADPCWDIEDEDGFCEHREELLGGFLLNITVRRKRWLIFT